MDLKKIAETLDAEFTSCINEIHATPLDDSGELKRIQLVQQLESATRMFSQLISKMMEKTIVEKLAISNHIQTKKQRAKQLEDMLQNSEETPESTVEAKPEETPEATSKKSNSWSQVVRKTVKTPKTSPKRSTIVQRSEVPQKKTKRNPRDYVGSALVQTPINIPSEKKVEIFPGFEIPVVYIDKPEDCLKLDYRGLLCKIKGTHPLKGFYHALNGIVLPGDVLTMLTSDKNPYLLVEYDPRYADNGTYYRPPELFPENSHDHRVLSSRAEYVPKNQDPGRKNIIYRIGDCSNFQDDLQAANQAEARLVCDIGDHYGLVSFLTRYYFSIKE